MKYAGCIQILSHRLYKTQHHRSLQTRIP